MRSREERYVYSSIVAIFLPMLCADVRVKIVYILSIGIGLIGCIVASLAKTTGVLLGMRVLQAVGYVRLLSSHLSSQYEKKTCRRSSSVLSIGAATLADIYEPHERGTMMGIYISAPLLGPALGPIIGGLLTQYFSWRATFWFLAVLMAVCLVAFLVAFKDTFRRERSVAYQTALWRVMKGRGEKRRSESDSVSTLEAEKVSVKVEDVEDEKCIDPQCGRETDVIPSYEIPPLDSEKTVASIPSSGEPEKSTTDVVLKEVHLSFRDVNPIPPLLAVLSRWNNIVILIASGTASSHTYNLPDDFLQAY